MKKLLIKLTMCLFVSTVVTGCLSDDLAFDVLESPVLAVFEDASSTGADLYGLTVTFYDLDKSGILDNAVGIDSLPISDLSISVFINESTLISSLTTDDAGKVFFEASYQDIGTSGRLEWVGTYDGVPFRIYKNF